MPDSSLHLSKPTLAYAKLVATPNETAWSQVYNAGNIFACLSLTVTDAAAQEDISLPAIGKRILDVLQAEFFTLEEKTMPSITGVITKSLEDVPEFIAIDVSVGFFKESLLYLFIVGHGRVIMKRQGKIGKLLESRESHKKVLTASGFLQNEDTVILETKQFAEDITDAALASALELSLPNDIAEALSPQLHTKEDGGQAAIIIVYHGVGKEVPTDEISEDEQEGLEQPHEDMPHQPFVHHQPTDGDESDEEDGEEEPRKKMHLKLPKLPGFDFLSPLIARFGKPSSFKLTHTRKLFLSITIILILLLVVSIFLTKKKESDAKLHEQFVQIYQPAEQKYESGKALETLNKDLSYQDYVEAKNLLSENTSKFPNGSNEQKQILDLRTKVETALQGSSPTETANAKEATVDPHSLLAVEKANSDGRGFTQDDKAVYFVTDKAIVSVSKSSGKKSDLIKNNNAWTDAAGLATYQGNFYVLDHKNGIVKFVSGSDGFGQSSYFKDKPNLTSSRALAIDSSVWILMQDGSVLKFISGTPDGYKVPTLEKPISDPVKIFTDASTSSIYILDRGNSRVVKIAKDGGDHAEYSSGVIKNAKDFEVKEKDKKILLLSGDKIYEISL